MKIINIFKTLGVASATSFAQFIVVSCSDDSPYDVYKDFDYSDLDWTKVKYFEATVDEWNDGDTFRFTDDNIDQSGMKGSDIGEFRRIRIASLDTPEMGTTSNGIYEDTTGVEREIAEAGADFANSIAGNGSRVRVITNMSTTYDRLVGSVWYGDNFEKSYSVELMYKGLAQPTTGTSDVLTYIDNPSSVFHYNAWPMLYAFQHAKGKNLGFWKHDINEVFGVRGYGSWDVVQPGSAAEEYKNEGFIQ